MGSGASKGVNGGRIVEDGESSVHGGGRFGRCGVLGFARACFSCSPVSFEEAVVSENNVRRHRSNGASSTDYHVKSNQERGSECMHFVFPCRGGIMGSPSSETEWIDDHNLDSASSSSSSSTISDSGVSHSIPAHATAIAETSHSRFSHSGSCLHVVSSLGSSALNQTNASSASTQNSSNGNYSFNARTEVHGRGMIRVDPGEEEVAALNSQWYNLQNQNLERRPSRRNGFQQDPCEGSVQFSRTLSVGRLRDRVLRQSSLHDGASVHELSEEGRVGNHGGLTGRRALHQAMRGALISYGAMDRTNHGFDLGNTSDQRSVFLERRRRLRSQVWALQRLGSRMENLLGDEIPCLLCSQSSTGHCTCESRSRPSNTAENNVNPRSSISRIVLLAEALFEVLDEIHQQAAVLDSRPSMSSPVGSVPAPKEVVEHIPLRTYQNRGGQKDEAVQCYICLLEYEEGDPVRVLPCGHEFHQSCVDKWLKEVHRVCPLCRGDVCISELAPLDKLGSNW
ncbi:RING/U-box superfamily protein isoform X2 [Wolffia australiana]